jgi:hypothetical protein
MVKKHKTWSSTHSSSAHVSFHLAAYGERQTIAEWLTPLNFKVSQRDVFEQRTDGTGQWLLASNEFQTWLSGESKTLWCCGMREMPFLSSPFSYLIQLLDSRWWEDRPFVCINPTNY